MNKKYILTILISVMPASLFAQDFTAFGSLVNNFTKNVVSSIGYLFITIAVVAFFWGIASFIFASRNGEEKELEEGRKFMVWGIIALFVMFSIWGIIRFFQGAVPGFNNTTITLPSITAPSTNGSGTGVPTPIIPPNGSGTGVPTPATSPNGSGTGVPTTVTPTTSTNGSGSGVQTPLNTPDKKSVSNLPSGVACVTSTDCASLICTGDTGQMVCQ